MSEAPLFLTVLLGVVGGVAVGTQGPIAGAMSQRIGGAAGSLVVHLSGALASAGLLLVRRGEAIAGWRSLPWYMLGSGVFGVILYLTLHRTVPRLGATAALTLVIVGQLLAGLVIDQLGLFGLSLRPVDGQRLLGMALLVAGGYLMVR